MITATYYLKTRKTEFAFGKKKIFVKGKRIETFTGQLSVMIGDIMPWKLSLGHDANSHLFTLSIDEVPF